MTITLTREEAQQVLDAMLKFGRPIADQVDEEVYYGAAETLRARLSAPEPEPVAWLHSFTGYGWQVVPEKLYPTDQPLYTAPPQREWQGLTDEELLACYSNRGNVFYRAIEAKLKEKNA
jgi:hypothetical protein